MANLELVGTAEKLIKLVMASLKLVGKAEKLVDLLYNIPVLPN